jgi:hypothetical protein
MGTKNNPGRFDCYGNAHPDEPMFILLGRDQHAHSAVLKWADDREHLINVGVKPESDRPMVTEARQCADAMLAYRRRIQNNAAPRFAETWCSQCGKSFGPGDSGYSHCSDHRTEVTNGTKTR